MSKVMLVANQVSELDHSDEVAYIGVDGGALWLLQHDIKMDYAIGDFDSVDKHTLKQLAETTQIECLPTRKNESDSEYAIKFASLHYDEVFITGVSGGRLDHFVSLYHMLAFQPYSFTIVDTQNTIYKLAQGVHKIKKERTYLSLFAVEDAIISIHGVEYPLRDQSLNLQDIYTLSNEITNEYATLEIHQGSVIVIQSEDKKTAP